MEWLGRSALVVLILTVCDADGCNESIPIPDFLPPKFGGEENLSSEECGKVANDSTHYPWDVKIYFDTESWGFWPGILISKNAVLTTYMGDKILNVNNKVNLGECAHAEHTPLNCTEGRGAEIEIERSIRDESGVLVLLILKSSALVSNWIRPICLFNKGSGHDVGSYKYQMHLLLFKIDTVAKDYALQKPADCTKRIFELVAQEKFPENLCANLSRWYSLCGDVHFTGQESTLPNWILFPSVLLNFRDGRYYIRGTKMILKPKVQHEVDRESSFEALIFVFDFLSVSDWLTTNVPELAGAYL